LNSNAIDPNQKRKYIKKNKKGKGKLSTRRRTWRPFIGYRVHLLGNLDPPPSVQFLRHYGAGKLE